jgi:Iap family predicted aminopeptidase
MRTGLLRRVVAVGIFVFTAALALSVAQIHLQLLTQDAIEARLRAYRGTDFDREAELKKLFLESGCRADQLSEQIVKKKQPPNVICVLSGASQDEIVVGAHFDHVDAGDGVVDNWSSASLLPSLLFSVRQDHRKSTYVFIGFMGEEEHLVGSEYYAEHLSPEQRQRIRAMVNMDTLGLGPTEVWTSHSNPTLAGLLGGMANNLHLALYGVNVDKVGTTDSESFARYKIPRITIHTLTQQTLPILHSRRDTLDKIRMSDYYDSYKLIAAYLVALDQFVDRKPEVPAATGGDAAKAQAH